MAKRDKDWRQSAEEKLTDITSEKLGTQQQPNVCLHCGGHLTHQDVFDILLDTWVPCPNDKK